MTDYASLLSLDGVVFPVNGTEWKTRYIKLPIPNGDRLVYVLGFTSQNSDAEERTLKLTISEVGFKMDQTKHRKIIINNLIPGFLGSDSTAGEIEYLCN
ncbi:MAG TPA: hypothetical protein VFK06_04900 [Candidatus Angelobacter sp.]|nr:hypothetical protein [Candidatus Angelobacter sp.]